MIDKGKKMSDKFSVLKDYFGHDSFRDGQEQIVDALLDGRDALCIAHRCGQVYVLSDSRITF